MAKVGEVVGAVVKGDKAKLAQSAMGEAPMQRTTENIRRFLKAIPDSISDSFDTGVRPAKVERKRLEMRSTPSVDEADANDNVYRHEHGPASRPSVTIPFQKRPLLPASASEGLTSEPLPKRTYPKLNESTAVDRTRRPIYPKPEPPKTSPMKVTPQGEVQIERPALKAPEPKLSKKAKTILGR